MVDHVEGRQTGRSSLLTRRTLLKACGSALLLGPFAVRSSAAGLDDLKDAAQVIDRDALIRDIQNTYCVGMVEPDRPISTYDLARQLSGGFDEAEYVGRIGPIRARVVRHLLSMGMQDVSWKFKVPLAFLRDNEDLYKRSAPRLERWDGKTLNMIATTLGALCPPHFYQPSGQRVEFYIADRQIDPGIDGFRSALGDDQHRVHEDEWTNTLGFRAVCDCVMRYNETAEMIEPSIVINKDLINVDSFESAKDSIVTVMHELTHVVIESAPQEIILGDYSEMSTQITRGALESLGFGHISSGNWLSALKDLLKASGDVTVINEGDHDETYEGDAAITRALSGIHEFVPYAIEYYLEGREFFLRELGRVFGIANAKAFYEYLWCNLFIEREYQPGELDSVAQSLVTSS